MAKSTKSAASLKPYKSFPLTAHRGANQWCKKFQGRTHYFGSLADHQKALDKFNRDWPYIREGRTPPPSDLDQPDGITMRDLCNAFIVSRQHRVASNELSTHSYAEYYRTCETLLSHFGPEGTVEGLRPWDFERFRAKLARGCNVVTLKSKINRCRVVFKFAHDNGLISHPVRYGTAFDRPRPKVIRAARQEAGERMFEADELWRIIGAATQPLKAMILLGINCGFGNTDCASLPRSAVDLDAGWIEFPRPKTAVMRSCPLWPETIAALREALPKRPKHRNAADADLCFLTTRRTRFVRVQESQTSKGKHVTISSVARRFDSLLDDLEIKGRRGLGFYALRHTFETIGGEAKDQVAVDAIMGHVDPTTAAEYRERISNERLRNVVDHVRRWLRGGDR